MNPDDIRERAAEILGWTFRDASSLSFQALRDILRTAPQTKHRDALIAEITRRIQSGGYIV